MADSDDCDFLSQVKTCENCNHVVHQPFNECRNGHKYCDECTDSFDGNYCPKCKVNLIFGPLFKHEHLYPPDNFPCINDCYGCKFTGDMIECMNHQEMCEYGPYPCPWTTEVTPCKWSEEHPQLTRHIEEAHPELIQWGKPGNINEAKIGCIHNFRREWFGYPVDTSKAIDIAFKSHNEWFLLAFRIENKDQLRIHVEHLAPRHEQKVKMFKYNIRFGKRNAMKRDGVLDNCGDYCRVFLKDLAKRCQENGDLYYEIEVFDKETYSESEQGFVLG